jgi:hypothetical protein
LLDIFSLMAATFRFDVLPGPSPTPPVKQQIGSGPFLSEEAIVARVREKYGNKVNLLQAQLVSEAEARKPEYNCYSFQGHPEGIWLLKVEGLFEPQSQAAYLLFDAVSGIELCGSYIPPPTPVSPDIATFPATSPAPIP